MDYKKLALFTSLVIAISSCSKEDPSITSVKNQQFIFENGPMFGWSTGDIIKLVGGKLEIEVNAYLQNGKRYVSVQYNYEINHWVSDYMYGAVKWEVVDNTIVYGPVFFKRKTFGKWEKDTGEPNIFSFEIYSEYYRKKQR